jgi:hypothetical protein
MLGDRPGWMLFLELLGDDVSDHREDEDPRGVEVDGDSENFADA